MYRILTERKNVDLVKRTIGMLGLDYTVYYGDGSWHGCPEASMSIELDNVTSDDARRAATTIKRINGQEAVLLQKIHSDDQML